MEFSLNDRLFRNYERTTPVSILDLIIDYYTVEPSPITAGTYIFELPIKELNLLLEKGTFHVKSIKVTHIVEIQYYLKAAAIERHIGFHNVFNEHYDTKNASYSTDLAFNDPDSGWIRLEVTDGGENSPIWLFTFDDLKFFIEEKANG